MTDIELTNRYWAAVQECLEKFHAFDALDAFKSVQEVRGRLAQAPALGRSVPQDPEDADRSDDAAKLPTFEDLIYHAEPWNAASDIAGSSSPPTNEEASRYRALLVDHGLAPGPRE
jgi:hypothetical protein